MPITPPNGMANEIEARLRAKARAIHDELVQLLIEEATEIVGSIKTPVSSGGYRSYHDQTGNLTSSVGFAVVENGNIIYEYGFEQKLATATVGNEEGKVYARQLASIDTSGLYVVVCAGMNYAKWVEIQGLGGMTAGEQGLRERVRTRLQQLIDNI